MRPLHDLNSVASLVHQNPLIFFLLCLQQKRPCINTRAVVTKTVKTKTVMTKTVMTKAVMTKSLRHHCLRDDKDSEF